MREGDLIVLLGAGTSVEAGIPHSGEMVNQVEGLLQRDETWKRYLALYQFIKASLISADVMKGKPAACPDIERIVNTLAELEKNTDCTLYPFISGWHQRFCDLAGRNFENVKSFRRLIIRQLRDWIAINSYSRSSYYEGLFRLRDELNFAIRIFSLNYDLCVEQNAQARPLEMGFDRETESWDFRRFEAREEVATHVYLYKLHGSITWYRDRQEGNILKLSATPHAEPDLIFGTDYKMQYIDPYLFYAYELRRYSLEAKIILTIGYSFRDEHINGIITQALRHDHNRILLAVSPRASISIKELGGAGGSQYKTHDAPAASFLNEVTIVQLEELAGIQREETPLPETASGGVGGQGMSGEAE
jgi:hypothetical protein